MIKVRLLQKSSHKIDQSKQNLAAWLFSSSCYNEERWYGDHFFWESKLKDSCLYMETREKQSQRWPFLKTSRHLDAKPTIYTDVNIKE